MGVNYYEVLKVKRDSTEEELKNAYKRMAVKYHPDKNPVKEKEAEPRFKLVSEAYDVLPDLYRRQMCDLYGGIFPPSSSTSDAEDDPRDSDDVFAEFLGGGGWGNGNGESGRRQKAPAVEEKLVCSLEDLYKGNVKKMIVSRIVLDVFGLFIYIFFIGVLFFSSIIGVSSIMRDIMNCV